MAPHSSAPAWKILWTEEPGGLQSMGSQRVGHDWVTSLSLSTFMHWRRKWQPTPVFLPGESQGWGSLVGYRLWGRRVGHDWSDLAAAAEYWEEFPVLYNCEFFSEFSPEIMLGFVQVHTEYSWRNWRWAEGQWWHYCQLGEWNIEGSGEEFIHL